jgi:intracellular multiplication protein IcmC
MSSQLKLARAAFQRVLTRNSGINGTFLLVLLLFAACPSSAWATQYMAATLGGIICNARFSSEAYPHFMAALAYIMGGVLILRGVLSMKRASDSPQNSPVIPIAQMVGGGFLITLPIAVGMVQRTIFGDVAAGNPAMCSFTDPTNDGQLGLDVMAQNFVRNIHTPVFSLLSVLCYAIGTFYILAGLYKASKTGTDPRASSPKDIVTYLVIGALLVTIGGSITMILTTLFGDAGDMSNMSNFVGVNWLPIVGNGANTESMDNTIEALLAFVQIVGGIAFVRGWLLMKAAVEGAPAKTAQAITHIVGGAMAINIDQMLLVFDTTFGTNILNAAGDG